jgi:hypothetical protein
MGKIDKRLDDLERVINPPADPVINVRMFYIDDQGQKRDYDTGELIIHKPGVQVITVYPPDKDGKYGDR